MLDDRDYGLLISVPPNSASMGPCLQLVHIMCSVTCQVYEWVSWSLRSGAEFVKLGGGGERLES